MSGPSRTPVIVPARKPAAKPEHVAKQSKSWCCCGGGRGQEPQPWQRKWMQILGNVRARMQPTKDEPQTLLELMVRMYAHEDVIPEIVARDADQPAEATLYLNSIINFLINGNYEHSRELERFLLSKCSRSLRFAHMLHWYLASHAARSTYTSEVRRPNPTTGLVVPVPLITAVGIYASWAGVPKSPVAPSSEPEAKSIHSSSSEPVELPHPIVAPPLSPRCSFDGAMAEAGSTSPSKSVGAGGGVVPFSEAGMTVFRETLNFIDNLTQLADALIPVRPQDRKRALQAGLQRLNEDFCHGSQNMYLPVGCGTNRILRIHWEKSRLFSTKSRVPCFIVFEIIDYELAESQARAAEARATQAHRRKSIKDIMLQGLSRMGIGSPSDAEGEHHSHGKSHLEGVSEHGPSVMVTSPLVTANAHSSHRLHDSSSSEVKYGPPPITVELSPIPLAITASDVIVEEDVVIAVGERRLSERPDVDLENELKAGLEAFEMVSQPSLEVDAVHAGAGKETPTASAQEQERIRSAQAMFGRSWAQECEEIRRHSVHGREPGWRLVAAMVKSNDDLRQEQFVSQLLKRLYAIAKEDKVPVWMWPYDILATGPAEGILEAMPNTMSLDSLKKSDPHFTTLADFFQRRWGSISPQALQEAQKCFVQSLAAYSIATYILQIKDRHNGNIMLDSRGHLIHIDFGFVFTNSPGGNAKFESAPFKLTTEFVEVMGGPRSELFQAYRKLCVRTFLAFRKQRDDIIVMVEMMLAGNSDLPGFRDGPDAVMAGLQARFFPGVSRRAAARRAHGLVDASLGSWRTTLYDKYQQCCEGIL